MQTTQIEIQSFVKDQLVINIKKIRWRKNEFFEFSISRCSCISIIQASQHLKRISNFFSKRFQNYYSIISTWSIRRMNDRMNRKLNWFRYSFIQSWENVSRDKITNNFERVKIEVNHHISLRMRLITSLLA
jgi:hypothetical protein